MTVDRAALRARLLDLFLVELDGHVMSLNRGLLALEQQPAASADAELMNELFRAAHSLKGAAHAAGVAEVEAICHRLEDVLVQLRDGRISLGSGSLEAMFRSVDAIASAGRQLRQGQELSRSSFAGVIEALSVASGTGGDLQSLPAGEVPPGSRPEPFVSETSVTHQPRIEMPAGVRVAADRLEAILNHAGEVLLVGQRIHELAIALAATSAETAVPGSTSKSENALSTVDDEQGKPAAGMKQCAGGRDTHRRLDELARSAAATDRLLSGVAQALNRTARQARMLPFAQAIEGLPRVARDLCKAGGKEVRLEIDGGDIELDRPIIEALREPLMHLVRNAIDHGIEEPDVREQAGKPRAGRITITTSVEGASVTVTVADDGRGVGVAALRKAAERRGVEVRDDDNGALLELAFTPGISTAPIITEISGRGIGLDAVRARVEAIGGSVKLSSELGIGTGVVLALPVTLSAVRVLLVSLVGQVYGLPSSWVTRLLRARLADLIVVDGREMLPFDSRPVPLLRLAQVLGLQDEPEAAEELDAVLVDVAGSQALVAVGGFLAEEEVVMKPAGERLAGLPGVLGATILPTGRVALILNPATCVRMGLASPPGRRAPLPGTEQERARPKRVLLVEDTFTTRALERSILEAAGYEVIVAVDGAEAWQLLQEHVVDAVVSDVDMPRLGGVELCEAVRASSRAGHLPFVLVTSLATDEDRRRGVEAGADAYIVKSDFEQAMLIETLERLL